MNIISIVTGGLDKPKLLRKLQEKHINLNPFAEQLIHHQLFTLDLAEKKTDLVILTVAELGLKNGGNLKEVFGAATDLGYGLCESYVGPFLSLQYDDYHSSHGLKSQHRAPDDSLTIASKVLDESVDFPKGFYIRKIEGDHWLRAYTCDYLHIFSPRDTFVFRINSTLLN